MALQGNDLALLTARFGCARFGASRFGFVPCPEDVMGAGTDEPGEYIYREDEEVVTPWTLVGEDCICRNLCTLALGAISLTDETPETGIDITASVDLTGVLGDVFGIARINWGDGQHEQTAHTPLVNGTLQFTNHYHAAGSYTITISVTDERGCTVAQTKAVTVASLAPLAGDFTPVATGVHSPGNGILNLDLDAPGITGGSGDYSYSWSAWTAEYGSEGLPVFTGTSATEAWTPLYDYRDSGGGYDIQVGYAKLVVTDNQTLLTLTIGPKTWDWVA